MEEPIQSFPIHSLPESLILECLARLHLKYLPVATRVCRKWFHLIGSRHFYALRKQLGYTHHVACFLQQCILQTPNPSFKNRINVFDPMYQEWSRLPLIPIYTDEFLSLTSITSFEGKLIMFGDYNPMSPDPVKAVFVLDFVTQRLKKGKCMPLIKNAKFSMVASHYHRIFFGGDIGREECAVWEYDVLKDEWSVLHQVRGWRMIQLQVIREELWIIKKINMFKDHIADVYHIQIEKWRQVELTLKRFNNLLWLPADMELYVLLKKLCENDFTNKFFQECHRLHLGKQSLIMFPNIKVDDSDDREELFYMQDQDGNLKRMQTSSSDFSRLVRSCCCVEF